MAHRSAALVFVHVVWVTEGREALLPPSFDGTLTAMLREKAAELGCELRVVGCASDHVHVLARLAPTVALSVLVQRLKGASAHAINARRLLPMRVAWRPRYWAQSANPDDLVALVAYIGNQRAHHDATTLAEPWQRAEF